MLILLIILLLSLFLFITNKMFKIFFQKKTSKTIKKIFLGYEDNLIKLDKIFEKWHNSLYENEIISLLLPKNSNDIFVLCSFTNKKKENSILAVPQNILKKFLYDKSSLIIYLKESPNKNLYLNCKINSIIFDVSLKMPYFFDKEDVFIIDDVKSLENLFFKNNEIL